MEKKIQLKAQATKTGLVELLRSRGIKIPSIRNAQMENLGDTIWLRWSDTNGRRNGAYYRCFDSRPYLLVAGKWEELTFAECAKFKLLKEVPTHVHTA